MFCLPFLVGKVDHLKSNIRVFERWSYFYSLRVPYRSSGHCTYQTHEQKRLWVSAHACVSPQSEITSNLYFIYPPGEIATQTQHKNARSKSIKSCLKMS